MSLMPLNFRFLSAANARNWKIAYDECNGLNMVDMLDSLDELGPDLLRDMRAQMATYDVCGGPNMPRIRFAGRRGVAENPRGRAGCQYPHQHCDPGSIVRRNGALPLGHCGQSARSS